ncbi:MAG: hypothetical protein HZB39_04490 [Planctomycetes bacterium]|nr:hypothetical protein [Planctomycetota bacterium]
MSKKKAATTAESRVSITKPLFEAGMQCAKRLYLERNEAPSKPELDDYHQELLELGGARSSSSWRVSRSRRASTSARTTSTTR